MTPKDLISRLAAATGPDALLDLQIYALLEPAVAGKAIQEDGSPTELADHLEVPAFTADLDAARRMVALALN